MSKLGHVLATLPTLVLLAAVAACAGTSGPAASDPTPAAAPTADDAARAFVAYAGGDGAGTDVPWGDSVRFSIAGEQVAQLSPDFAARREGWVRCPGAVTEYEGRRCPVSGLTPVRALVQEGGQPRLETDAPETVGCSTYRLPWEGAGTVWIRPDEDHRDCVTDFAIAVATDGDGAIVAVDLALSGP